MSLMLSLFAVTAACTPAATPAKDHVAITQKLFTAIAANDEAAIGALLKPGARMYEPGDSYGLDLAELFSMLTAQGKGGMIKLVKASKTADPNLVEAITDTEGAGQRTSIFTFDGGCLVKMMTNKA